MRRHGLISAVIAAAALYHLWRWGVVSSFGPTLDHGDVLFEDFVTFYHPTAQAMLAGGEPVPRYLYSAFFGLLLAPLGVLPLGAALWGWGAIQVAGIVLLCSAPVVAASSPASRQRALYVALCLTSVPVLHNFRWGQISVLLTAAVLGAFALADRGRRATGGSLLATAAAIKFYPAVFALYFAFRRDVRVFAAFIVAGLLFYAVVPAAVLGPRTWLAFESQTQAAVADTARNWTGDINSQYLVHGVTRLSQLVRHVPLGEGQARAVEWAGYLVAGCSLILVAWLARWDVPGSWRIATSVLFLSLPLVIRTSWPHYFAYLPFCQTVACAEIWRRTRDSRAWSAGLIPVVVSMFLSSVLAFDLFAPWNRYNGRATLLVSDLLLLAVVYVLALTQPPARVEHDGLRRHG